MIRPERTLQAPLVCNPSDLRAVSNGTNRGVKSYCILSTKGTISKIRIVSNCNSGMTVVQVSDFQDDAPGRLIRNLVGQWTFLPNPLPPSLFWTEELASILAHANWAVGRLSGVGQGLTNPHLLIHPFLRREAVLSSRIEGTQASLQDLFLFEEAASVESTVPDVREVANYVRALEYGLSWLRDRQVTLGLIRELHQLLMENVRGGDKTPGEFRTVQNFVGRTARIEDARFVPPPPLEVAPAMQELERFLRARNGMPSLVRLALVHYQFEAVHPFVDGNGRIGRLLVTLLLCAEGLLPLPLLYLSAYFERHREAYYRHLLHISTRGQWAAWLAFFLQGVKEQSADAIKRSERLTALRGEYHQAVQQMRVSALAVRLVDELFATPAITTGRAAKLLGVTFHTAQRLIDRLIERNVLANASERKRNRVFIASDIIRLLEQPL